MPTPLNGAGERRPHVVRQSVPEAGDLVFDAEFLFLESVDRVVVWLRVGFEFIDGTFKLGMLGPKGLDMTVQTHG